MTSPNIISKKKFKPLTLAVIKKMEHLKQSAIPMSMCLPSSIYIWDTKNNYSYLKVTPSLYLIKRYEWLEDKTPVYSCTLIYSKKDLSKLLELAKKLNIKIMNEISIINPNKIKLPRDIKTHQDINHAEYIYKTEDLSKLEGSKYAEIRSKIRKFQSNYNDNYFIVDNNPPNKKNIADIGRLYESWHELSNHDVNLASKKEKDALKKLTDAYKIDTNLLFLKNQLFYYLYVKKSLVGFSVVEQVNTKGAVGHFLKLNHNITGISEYFITSIAKDLFSKKIELLNTEEDMGIKGLREFKQSLRPYLLLKSYDITLE